MKKILFFTAFLSFLLLMVSLAEAADPTSIVNKANRLYRSKKYEEASSLYNQALTQAPDSSIINYNLGSSDYRLGDFDKAAESFKRSLTALDKRQEAWAHFNLGNSKYKSAESKQKSDLNGAVKSLEESVRYFKRAIELAPQDRDAKINYELADKLLKELRAQLKQQQSKQNQEQKQDQQKKEEQQQQQQKQQEQQQQEQQQQPQKQQEQQQEEREKQSQKEQEQQQQEQQPQSGEEQGEKEMSQQEAGMLLEGLRQEEKEMGRLQDNRRGVPEDVQKDW